MKYTQYHKKKILTEAVLLRHRIEAGMIIQFIYTKEHPRKETKEYMVLVLNPKYNEHLHALSLEVLTPFDFNRFVKKTKIIITKTISKAKKLDIPEIDLANIHPHSFYLKEIRNKSGLYIGYRTFKVSRLKNIKILDYNFKKEAYKETAWRKIYPGQETDQKVKKIGGFERVEPKR